MIATTERIRRRLLEVGAVAEERVTVVTNGVEFGFFDGHPQGRSVTETGKKTVVFAGNLAPYQGIELLLRAFREVLNRREDVRLMIFSDSPFNDFEATANALKIRNSIDIVEGTFSSLPAYLDRANVAVNPRTSCDGIPQKLLNYMAAGKAIVSFQGSAGPLEHGKTGWIVENNNIDAFAKAVLRLLEDSALAQQLGAAAKNHVRTQCTWEKTAEKLEDVYERVLRDASDQKTKNTSDHKFAWAARIRSPQI